MNEKIQTGLRLPVALYEQLSEMADRNGLSINSQVLFLIDIGMQAVNLGVQEERRVLSRTAEDTAE